MITLKHKTHISAEIRERDHMEALDVDGRIILKEIFKQQAARAWTGLIWLPIGIGGASL